FILKPSPRVPLTSVRLMELLMETGIPDGVVNMVHGGVESVDWICKHPSIKAISFVGGNAAGEFIYRTGAAHGKRVQANMGAKNHCVVMPDADKEDALNMVANAAFGAAGQRCMALSVPVFVGEAREWLPELVERAKKFKAGHVSRSFRYVTTGYLLQVLIHRPDDVHLYTHIVLDEVHERTLDSDFLSLICKRLLLRPENGDTKLVIMSATLNSDLFS
ncbi:Methylmalonate-semialdehyde dehydrogenase [acylating] mitochondrial, partial [Perkinsus olseni]